MRIGVPYTDALKMPEHFAFALLGSLSNERQHNTRSVNQAPPRIQSKRRVATRRKSQESVE